jgi:hypothetical protein
VKDLLRRIRCDEPAATNLLLRTLYDESPTMNLSR